MKKIFIVLLVSVVLLGIIFSAGCVEYSTNTTTVKERSNLQNTVDVIDSVQKLTDGENTVISDLSLNMALGMVLAGANNTCQKELETFLNVSKEDNLGLNCELIDHYNSLSKTKVALANSFWFNTSFNLQTPYKNMITKYFDAEIAQYDFKDAKTTDIINNWCANKTNNLIKQIVNKGQVENTSNILINAVYFKGNWSSPFKEYQCKKELFNGFNEKYTVTMMRSTEGTYFENEKATGFKKPYSDRISFIGILPKNEGEFTLNELNINSLLKNKSNEYDVYIGIPKFKTECKINLVNSLKELGINNAFSDSSYDFDEIGRTNTNDRIKISDIIQKTFIDVNEKGTEAAAVTAVSMTPVAAALPKQKETKTVILDRPFVFLIVDETNDQILFAGKITNPQE